MATTNYTGFRYGVTTYRDKKEIVNWSDYFKTVDELFTHIRKRENLKHIMNKKLILIYEENGRRRTFGT